MPMSCIKFKLLCWMNHYLPQRKVMFSEASISHSEGVCLRGEGVGFLSRVEGVCLQGVGYPSRGRGYPSRGGFPSRGKGSPSWGSDSLLLLTSSGGHFSGRNASYWNAFLFSHLVSWFSRMSSYYVK